MVNVLILEDNYIQKKNLVKIIEGIDEKYVVYHTDNVEEGLDIALDKKISLFYVDIALKDASGLEFARNIRGMPQYKLTWIVFITTHVKYMLEAFKEIHCYDYIIKPYENKEVKEVTLALLKYGQVINLSIPVERNQIVFDMREISIKLFVDEIFFIEVSFRTSVVYSKTGKYELKNMTLKKVKRMLEEYDFIQVHRAYLVNLNLINTIDKTTSPWNIQFKDFKQNIPVGDKFREETLEAFKAVSKVYYE